MGACTRHGMTLGLILRALCESNWVLSKLNTYVKV